MKATYVPSKRTPFTPAALAQTLEYELGGDGSVPWQPIAVLMAHCALECGRDIVRGMIGPSCWNFNLVNIKASESYEGLFTCITLNEYLMRHGKRTLVWFAPQGELVAGPGSALQSAYAEKPWSVPPGHPQTRMRAHVSLEQGVRDKIAFLSQQRFAKARRSAWAGDAAQYVADIHKQKYFTADVGPYQRSVVSLTHSYEPIARRISDTPLALPPATEQRIAEVIATHARAPSMLDGELLEAVQFDLSQTWQDAWRRDRDAAVRGV